MANDTLLKKIINRILYVISAINMTKLFFHQGNLKPQKLLILLLPPTMINNILSFLLVLAPRLFSLSKFSCPPFSFDLII